MERRKFSRRGKFFKDVWLFFGRDRRGFRCLGRVLFFYGDKVFCSQSFLNCFKGYRWQIVDNYFVVGENWFIEIETFN